MIVEYTNKQRQLLHSPEIRLSDSVHFEPDETMRRNTEFKYNIFFLSFIWHVCSERTHLMTDAMDIINRMAMAISIQAKNTPINIHRVYHLAMINSNMTR